MEEDQSKKSEVSLPGAGGAEPTIIETLNKNTILNTTEDQKQNKSENKEQDQYNKEDSTNKKEEETPVEETIKTNPIKVDDLNRSDTENKQISDNILDIQSHLIETFDKNFSVSEDIDTSGVTVKEIPAKPEEFQTTSQIETETSPKSIIEIEPSIPKTHKPIQLDLDLSSNKRQSTLTNSFDEEDNNIIETEILNNNIKNINTDDKEILQKDLDTAKEVKIEISNKFVENEKDKIESSHIENNNNNILANENISDSSSKIQNHNENEKLIEIEKQNIEENINNSKDHKDLKEHCKVTTNQENNFEKLSKEDKEDKITDKNKESNPISTDNNLDVGIGINGLINCLTPFEEEEKKKLLDSLPQLDSNIDPHKLAVEAKKEYYQSLRDYLDKYQYEKPPIPLQTYRWEDLRRAKEKGGYPWTYLYKRPLGPDEEPEIVLLLRKSQEFTFHKQHNHQQHNHQASESPKSLKKVRIHDQVLVKETERYISDLSDTEELSSKASSPSSTGASTESEEDNKSVLSESCTSDSVSEGKKSKFSKLKGILKRKTGDNKKSQDNKLKKSIATKESTESKESGKLSSASPSPIPSNLPDSILSDEHLTATKPESDNQFDRNLKASIESEEDNKSALSESCVSDSVSEGKKSKFNKFKGILKGKTGDKKKSQDNKLKETVEIKESTESKESEKPSVSPLPTPSNLAESILSDELLATTRAESDKRTDRDHKANIKCEEDNKSALSESYASDSVSEGKKSKFSKVKGILKRKTGHNKKFQDKKLKESKETATFFSASPSPSPIPSDLPDSILSDEYLTASRADSDKQSDRDHKACIESEEDNKSAISESCAADSVSEGKKSKFNKFKAILKSKTGDTKKSQDNKPKESLEIKESAESKETARLSASPSPIPSDLPESIISDEYLTTTRTGSNNRSDRIHKASIESEEDNKSALSESCVSDSVSEGKKSKFNKFKAILKSKTGDTKKSQDSKPKESLEIKEPTESKETARLSASPSPIPSDLPESIISDEYLTTTRTGSNNRSDRIHKASIESEEDNKSALSESCVSDSVSEGKKSKFNKFKGILKSKTGDKKKSQENKLKESIEIKESTESKETTTLSSASPSPSPIPSDLPDSILSDEYLTATATESDNQSDRDHKPKPEESSPKKAKCCHPIMDKLKTMADKQFKKRNIKKISLKGDEKIVLEEQQKILKLRESPKADRGEIPKFVEKQDSEEIVEIVELEESPSSKRKEGTEAASILIPDEIIEIPQPQPTVKVQISQADSPDSPPRKTLRKMKDHVYEEIDPNTNEISMKIDEILQLASVEALKKSLAAQDDSILKDIEVTKKLILDRMGSSEEEIEKAVSKMSTLAPISSIDSTSSDEQEKRISLSTVAEESDAASVDGKINKEAADAITVIEEETDIELKPVLKKEPSPGPNGDKKVTFSHVEDESEPLREDLEVPEELKNIPNRWKDMA